MSSTEQVDKWQREQGLRLKKVWINWIELNYFRCSKANLACRLVKKMFFPTDTWGAFLWTKSPLKFSEFSLFEWNASDRFPEFEVTCSATQGMLDETLLCIKKADFFNIFAALERGDCETISCSILDSNDDVILLASVQAGAPALCEGN